MKRYNVVNYHITNSCNYHCIYCFGKFDGQNDPALADAKRIIDNIANYFKKCNITDGRINFAGGEPTLYVHLDELIDYTHELGIAISIVTNGSRLNPQQIRGWRGKVSCIGISIDSINSNINLAIGRCFQNKTINSSHWIEISKVIHECGIDLKVNTVVSKLNIAEDLSPLYRVMNPRRIKLFQMHLVDGINNQAILYDISKKEFEDFCASYNDSKSVIVPEPCGSMENSYLMINPEGMFQLNNNGTYQTFGDCRITSLCEILKSVPIDTDKFNARYIEEVAK